METNDHGTPDRTTHVLCPLEWFALATDAAKSVAERDDTGKFLLDYSSFYSEKLVGL